MDRVITSGLIAAGIALGVGCVGGVAAWGLTPPEKSTRIFPGNISRIGIGLSAFVGLFMLIPSGIIFQSVADLETNLNYALDLPRRAVADFETWTVNETELSECNTFRNLTIEQGRTYEFGNVRDYYSNVNDLKLYVWIPPVATTAILAAVAACLTLNTTAGIVAAGLAWLSVSGMFAACCALTVAIDVVCTDYFRLSELPAEFRWFVDPSSANDPFREFLSLSTIEAILANCNSPPSVLKYTRAGILANDYHQVRKETCTDVYTGALVTTVLLAAVLTVWIVSAMLVGNKV